MFCLQSILYLCLSQLSRKMVIGNHIFFTLGSTILEALLFLTLHPLYQVWYQDRAVSTIQRNWLGLSMWKMSMGSFQTWSNCFLQRWDSIVQRPKRWPISLILILFSSQQSTSWLACGFTLVKPLKIVGLTVEDQMAQVINLTIQIPTRYTSLLFTGLLQH